jgi:hypothetical protein
MRNKYALFRRRYRDAGGPAFYFRFNQGNGGIAE